jgi:hypothetical protein
MAQSTSHAETGCWAPRFAERAAAHHPRRTGLTEFPCGIFTPLGFGPAPPVRCRRLELAVSRGLMPPAAWGLAEARSPHGETPDPPSWLGWIATPLRRCPHAYAVASLPECAPHHAHASIPSPGHAVAACSRGRLVTRPYRYPCSHGRLATRPHRYPCLRGRRVTRPHRYPCSRGRLVIRPHRCPCSRVTRPRGHPYAAGVTRARYDRMLHSGASSPGGTASHPRPRYLASRPRHRQMPRHHSAGAVSPSTQLSREFGAPARARRPPWPAVRFCPAPVHKPYSDREIHVT